MRGSRVLIACENWLSSPEDSGNYLYRAVDWRLIVGLELNRGDGSFDGGGLVRHAERSRNQGLCVSDGPEKGNRRSMNLKSPPPSIPTLSPS